MKLQIFLSLALVSLVVAAGCGGRQNEVIVAPELDPAAQQQQYDDYDKQMAEDSSSYQ